jgi:hypothetical protein
MKAPSVMVLLLCAPLLFGVDSTVRLAVPFTCQAPLGVWDSLHEEACEEASLLMVVHFLRGEPIASPAAVDGELRALVRWEEERGYGPSVTLGSLATIAHDRFGLTGTVTEEVTLDHIRSALAVGSPVILAVGGRLLGNPYFTSPGPRYHLLVVTGCTPTGFLTNDPGTRRGEAFFYDTPTLDAALHDWTPGDIRTGPRRMLVLHADEG